MRGLFWLNAQSRWVIGLLMVGLSITGFFIFPQLFLKNKKQVEEKEELVVEDKEMGLPQKREKEVLSGEGVVEQKGEEEQRTEKKEKAEKGYFSLQVCSFQNRAKAEKIAKKLREKGFPAYIVRRDLGEKGVWFRVRIGEFKSSKEAEEVRQKISQEYKDSFVVY